MNTLFTLILAVGLVLVPVFVNAQEATAPAAVVQSVEVGNKICPVSNEKVGEMGDIVKQEYKGKIYNLCCTMCVKDFNKDPDKYAKIAEDEVAAVK